MIIGKVFTHYTKVKSPRQVEDKYKKHFIKEINKLKHSNILKMFIADEELLKYYKKRNILLEIGCIIKISRWDGNGIPDEQAITNITIIDEFSAKIKTKKGSIIFDTREKDNSKIFKWNSKQKDEWVRKYMNFVDFSYSYINSNKIIKNGNNL